MTNQLTFTRKSLFFLVLLLLVAAMAQAQNMFAFPYYQDIEGTNISNAWSILNDGSLSPYTYAYDEPPAGSFLLSLWTLITEGISSFETSTEAGRALMLGLHLLTAALVYGIARKTTKSDLAAFIAMLVFTFSPLATTLQRRVLVDNIMIVWLLLAFYLVLGDRRTLINYLSSAMFFGLAVLTKGAALYFLPAFVYTIRLKADPHHKRFATHLWIALAAFLIAFYPLYAQMKQELFPEGWLLGGDFPHVSLTERMLDRGPETGRFLNMGSGLEESFSLWVDISNISADPVLIYAGGISLLFILILAMDNRNIRPLVAMIVMAGFNLLFGGQVFNSDAIMLLPFLALNVGIVIAAVANLIGGSSSSGVIRFAFSGVTAAVLLYPFWMFYSHRTDIYTLNQVDGQVSAVEWINRYVPADAVVVADNYAFVELRQTHPYTHHYWRVDTDPAIKYNFLNDNICNIDYLLTTPQVFGDIDTFNMELMRRAVDHSEILISYENNGWPVEIRQVRKTGCTADIANGDIEDRSSS